MGFYGKEKISGGKFWDFLVGLKLISVDGRIPGFFKTWIFLNIGNLC